MFHPIAIKMCKLWETYNFIKGDLQQVYCHDPNKASLGITSFIHEEQYNYSWADVNTDSLFITSG